MWVAGGLVLVACARELSEFGEAPPPAPPPPPSSSTTHPSIHPTTYLYPTYTHLPTLHPPLSTPHPLVVACRQTCLVVSFAAEQSRSEQSRAEQSALRVLCLGDSIYLDEKDVSRGGEE
ncbi:hypothetical protein M0804_010635 [Polistes exclamans]|nr:hypothetical protein M0804_010635 [Polistes exclamans]